MVTKIKDTKKNYRNKSLTTVKCATTSRLKIKHAPNLTTIKYMCNPRAS